MQPGPRRQRHRAAGHRRGDLGHQRDRVRLWYWDLDRGGAAARAHHPYANPAFFFPEMLHTAYAPATWVPEFADYLSLAFWTATAFSPTDTRRPQWRRPDWVK